MGTQDGGDGGDFDLGSWDNKETRSEPLTAAHTEKPKWYKLALMQHVWEYCPDIEVLNYIKNMRITKSYMIRKESPHQATGFFDYMYVKCGEEDMEKMLKLDGVESITELNLKLGVKR